MKLASEARVMRHRRWRLRALPTVKIKALLTAACEHEAAAAELATAQPTRAVLYRSAATLAIDAEDLPTALGLAAKGLHSVEHDEIKQELIEVAKKAAQLL